ncbi:MAG: hypothetical protein A2X76_08210 [Lysobacterales bacterium GWF1_69_6]|nr:MAG: hypothetical protein A2X76_08210 [Xanthomonadales bacterium GWF1_69_6]
MARTVALAMPAQPGPTTRLAGCRRFLVADLAGDGARRMRWVELSEEDAVSCQAPLPAALADVDFIVASAIGRRLARHLAAQGVQVAVAGAGEPAALMADILAGRLPALDPERLDDGCCRARHRTRRRQ